MLGIMIKKAKQSNMKGSEKMVELKAICHRLGLIKWSRDGLSMLKVSSFETSCI